MSINRGRREPNLYGFLFSSGGDRVPWPGTQLKTLLKLQNNEFRSIKKNVTRLMLKHMDIEFKGTEQLTKLRAIENELKELYPEIFASEESKKRLYFATRLVLHLHANRRSKFKKRDEENPAAPTRRSPIITHKQKENQQSVVATQDLACESASHTLPRLKEFPMDIDPDVTCTIHDPKRYRDIHNFLEASMPPMTHLMDAFIDFGCINADFLLTISSWSIEKIRDVLDQLSPGSNGKQITEMDKFILEYHFKEYFTQKGRRGNKSDL